MPFHKKFIIILVTVLATAYVYNHFFPNEEKIIRENLSSIEKNLNIAKPEPYTAIIKKSKFLDKYFAENVYVTLKTKNYSKTIIVGVSEVTQNYIVMHTRVQELIFDFSNIKINIKDKNAVANLIASAKWTSFTSGKSYREELKLTLEMKKVEGKWLILKLTGEPTEEKDLYALNLASCTIE